MPGVHRGGDKLPAKIAESGAAGLRKFGVCVCVRVWRGYLVDDLVLQTSVGVFVGMWAVWELTRHVC